MISFDADRLKGACLKNSQHGITLIELVIVVAIIGILSALALPAYQSYLIRAQISEGLNLVGPLTNALASFHNENGAFPIDNDAAALESAGSYTGNYVDSISVNGAVISIQFGNQANAIINGQVVTLTATNNQGSVSWDCASGGFIADYHLPASCR